MSKCNWRCSGCGEKPPVLYDVQCSDGVWRKLCFSCAPHEGELADEVAARLRAEIAVDGAWERNR